jgi:hypothetical protein
MTKPVSGKSGVLETLNQPLDPVASLIGCYHFSFRLDKKKERSISLLEKMERVDGTNHAL